MKTISWSRPLAYLAVIGVVAGAFFLGRGGRGGDSSDDSTAQTADPGYAAHEAEIIETGYDGRERYRLNAKVIRQQTEAGLIELEDLRMNYHPEVQPRVAGESRSASAAPETWHLSAERGQVRADGDDVQLSGNVNVTGPAPGSGTPLKLTTTELRMNTPTQFIETRAPVTMTLSGYKLTAVGMQADLKAGTLRLESQVHGEFFSP